MDWIPFELHPEIPPEGMEMPQSLRDKFGGMNDILKTQAREAGYPYVTPEIIPNSRKALEATEYAREQGKLHEFHKAMFHKFYGEGKDMGNWEIIGEVADEVGLDIQSMKEAVESGKYKLVVNKHKMKAVEMGARGVPLFIFNNELVIMGLQPYETFQEVMDRLNEDAT